ncbi:FkbM family methyltransferase [Noviherbaspirillum malthae]|uniref:FkbM family methyltransferase n=1 Tax=Noviherbaspirillum malthae TaxID=1260987 RepID=UPI001890A288|nr:FkbM family methyltransferase [Noviherbaspirillum malthae]
MTFISYAQNFEDVILWRALKHVPNGFYIDVGANDPVVDSVTLAFYQQGWHGINVEPMRQYYEQLQAQRPRDTNLQLAVGAGPGNITFYDIPDTGLSTMEPNVARQHIEAGRNVVETNIEVLPLSEICARHVTGPIHFLKIDVEGFEAEVLRGMSFKSWRPWILVIEATRPQTQETAHAEWEHMVLEADYQPAYFDGLNQFYVANEHPELLAALKLPPNYFDHFQLRLRHHFSQYPYDLESRCHTAEMRLLEAEKQFGLAEAEVHKAHEHGRQVEAALLEAQEFARQADARALDLQQQIKDTQERLQEANANAHHIYEQLMAVHNSTSWRITRPVRAMKELMKQPVATLQKMPKPKAMAKAGVKWTLVQAKRELQTRPRLRNFVLGQLDRYPSLYQRMASISRNAAVNTAASPAAPQGKEGHASLPASVNRVLVELERAIDTKNAHKH